MVVKKVALNALALASGGIVAQICFLIIEALIARRLGSEAYGTYGAVYAIALQAGCVAEMGMAWKLLEEGSRDRTAIPHLLGTTIVLKLLFCGVLYLPMLGLLHFLGYSPDVIGFFAIFFGYAVLLSVQDSLAAVYAAHQRMHVSALFQGTMPVAILACVALATRSSQQLESIGWAFIAGAALVIGIWTWRTFLAERPHIDLRRAGEILRGSYLYGITGVLYQVILRIDLVLLSLLREMSEVGLFAACDKIADLGLKVGTLSARVISPVLFAQSRHEPQAYRRTCKLVIRAVSVVGVLGCLILALLAKPLLVGIFGAPFGAAAAALVVLAIALAARLVAAVLQMILSASDEHVRRTGSLAAALGVAIGVNIALIPRFGILGAAIARATADGLYVCSMLGARALPLSRTTAIAAILGPVTIGVAAYLSTFVLPPDLVTRLVAGLSFYAIGLMATRVVRRSDIDELLRLVRSLKSS